MDGDIDRPSVLAFRILHVWFLVHAAGFWYNIIHGSKVQTQDQWVQVLCQLLKQELVAYKKLILYLIIWKFRNCYVLLFLRYWFVMNGTAVSYTLCNFMYSVISWLSKNRVNIFLKLCYWKPKLVDFNAFVLMLQSGY
jgi:hypothetical protein